MSVIGRGGTLVALLVFSVSCSNADRPTAPSPLPAPLPAAPPPPTPGMPPLSGPATSYHYSGPLDHPVTGYTTTSKFVLYDSGAFSLQYASLALEYVGSYRQEAERILFDFRADGRWHALGTLNGGSLEIRYNDTMLLSDFDNAVYERTQ